MTIWDVGGQDKIRLLWRHYFQNTMLLIYMIDANDRARFEESKEELEKLLEEDELNNAILLVLGNKVDQPEAASSLEITQIFELERLDRPWMIKMISSNNMDQNTCLSVFDWFEYLLFT